MTFPLRPNGARVVVKLDPKQDRYGAILIPRAYREQVVVGEAVAVGPGEWDYETGERIPLTVEVGQGVVVGKYNGVRFERDWLVRHGVDDPDHEYWICKCPLDGHEGNGVQDIYAVVEK